MMYTQYQDFLSVNIYLQIVLCPDMYECQI